MSYEYTLDGALDVVTRYTSGRYANGKTAIALPRAGMSTYDYDAAGQVELLTTNRIQHVPAKNRPHSTQAVTELVASEDLTRDLDGNPRVVDAKMQMADGKSPGKLRTQDRAFTYDVLGRLASDDIGDLPRRTYSFDNFGRMDRTATGSTVLEDRAYSDTASLGAMLTRTITTKAGPGAASALTTMVYGSGTTNGDNAGPRGQLVRTSQYSGASANSTDLTHETVYSFSALNEQTRALELTYVPSKTKKNSKGKAVAERSKIENEWMQTDLLGRRVAEVTNSLDPRKKNAPTYQATRLQYIGDEADPYAEASSDAKQPDTRWILRVNGQIEAEQRTMLGRYSIPNLQGSTSLILSADQAAKVEATFNYDSYGAQLTGPTSFTSGSKAERDASVYTFTGMRQSAVGETTSHHARDYNAALKSWLETDQYADPSADTVLSLDSANQNRSVYAGSNPISNVDLNGHMYPSEQGCSSDRCHRQAQSDANEANKENEAKIARQNGFCVGCLTENEQKSVLRYEGLRSDAKNWVSLYEEQLKHCTPNIIGLTDFHYNCSKKRTGECSGGRSLLAYCSLGDIRASATGAIELQTKLYRVVLEEELRSIEVEGAYTSGPNSMGKQFFDSAEDASRFARSMYRMSMGPEYGPFTLTSIEVPTGSLPAPIKLAGKESGNMYGFEEGEFPVGEPEIEISMRIPPV